MLRSDYGGRATASNVSHHGRTVYMYLDKDYDLPMMVEDTAKEMARKLGTTAQQIYNTIHKAKISGGKCRYLKLWIDEEDE